MIVVIQCAGSKQSSAGSLRTMDGKPVRFVAHPEKAPASESVVLARPDDTSDRGLTWRHVLEAYNRDPGSNPLGLLPAFELYQNRIYRELVDRYGVGKTYILSAGWGLISAFYLTPAYDVTFNIQGDPHVRRRKQDLFDDFCMLPADTIEPIVCVASKEYVLLFAQLTRGMKARRVVFYNAGSPPVATGCDLIRYETRTRTNWQYECAASLLRGELGVA